MNMKTAKNPEVIKAVSDFIHYINLGWATEESFDIAYDSVFDILSKEDFLNACQKACKEQELQLLN